uniref:Uncharacterized protein n=1 Tax=Rhizophora mucronata TaxID=61149 RepID=A0A2P2IQ03_RHIMU
MELEANSKTGQTSTPDPKPDLEDPNNEKAAVDAFESQHLFEDFDSNCSTPYVSAPSSPGRGPVNGGFFYSCPASPMHFAITTTTAALLSSSSSSSDNAYGSGTVPLGYEFEFSARSGSTASSQTGSMSSADELFLNGQIRPMKLSTHLERPQVLAPLFDLENEEEDDDQDDNGSHSGSRMTNKESASSSRGRDLRLRDKSLRRRTRSMSPLRSANFEFGRGEDSDGKNLSNIESYGDRLEGNESIKVEEEEATSTPSVSASSSRSSSAGRNSKRWVFLKDFLYRSKSEGRSTNKFWSNISFSPAKDKKPINSTTAAPASVQVAAVSKDKGNSNVSRNNVAVENQKVKGSGQGSGKKPVNGIGKRRVPASPHELHYKASRAQAEELRKKTFLPYRQGLLGCLGFSSKGYGAMNGFARALNPVSSR